MSETGITPSVDPALRERARAARGNVAGIMEVARAVESDAEDTLAPVRVAMLATFTAEALRPYMIVEGAARGLRLVPAFAPFDQLEIQTLDERSPLYSGNPNVIVVAPRLEELAPRLVSRFTAIKSADVSDEMDAVGQRIKALLEGIRKRTGAAILVWNFARPYRFSAGLAAPTLQPSQASMIEHLNSRVASIAGDVMDAHVMDIAGLASERGAARMIDHRMWLRASVPYGAEGLASVAALIARCIAALRRAPRKCLVLDLDNTLWGGVLGEDGAGGIRMGREHPGAVYREFQEYLLALRDRGILLAVASKNDSEDALKILADHPDCRLRPDLISATEIGWGDKATSLRNIARQLNLGVDALAFFDDSAVEREWIRSQLPEVAVIDVPPEPLGYIDALENSEVFDALHLSSEDQQRAEMYRDESGRRRLQDQLPTLEAFLHDLHIKVLIGPIGPPTLPRVAQLLGKTNQFNTTTRRYNEREVEDLVARRAVALWARVSDRFGDSGLVGVAIASPDVSEGDWRIDSLLLSCRVIGRGIESSVLSELARRVRERGGRRLIGEFLPTARNEPAKGVYRDHGFEPLDEVGRLWAYEIVAQAPASPPHIQLTIEDDIDE